MKNLCHDCLGGTVDLEEMDIIVHGTVERHKICGKCRERRRLSSEKRDREVKESRERPQTTPHPSPRWARTETDEDIIAWKYSGQWDRWGR